MRWPCALDKPVRFDVLKFLTEDQRKAERVICYGRMRYRSGQKTKSLRFIVRVRTWPPGPQAYAPASSVYDLELKAGVAGYTATIPVAQTVGPKAVDRFDIRVISDKTAEYDLTLSVVGQSGKKVAEQFVHINILRTKGLKVALDSNPNLHERVPLSILPTSPRLRMVEAITIDPRETNQYFVFLNVTWDDYWKDYFRMRGKNRRGIWEEIEPWLKQYAKDAGHQKYQFIIVDSQGVPKSGHGVRSRQCQGFPRNPGRFHPGSGLSPSLDQLGAIEREASFL